jgi:hypothetical protein
MYNLGGKDGIPQWPGFQPLTLPGWTEDKKPDKLTNFKVDPMTLGMYANYYKGCLPCGPR